MCTKGHWAPWQVVLMVWGDKGSVVTKPTEPSSWISCKQSFIPKNIVEFYFDMRDHFAPSAELPLWSWRLLSGALAPGMVSHGKLALEEGSDWDRFETLNEMDQQPHHEILPSKGKPEKLPGARPGVGACRWATGGWALFPGAQPGQALRTTGGPFHVDPPPAGRTIKVRCNTC